MKLFTQGRYATVASTAALVVALGGTSYAAALITTQNIKDGTIQTVDVNPSARTIAKSVHNDNGTVMGSTKAVLSLNLQPGRYVVNSKAVALYSSSGAYASCSIISPNSTNLDTSWWYAGSDVGYGTLADQAVISIGSTGTVQLSCFGGASTLYYKKLTAVRVADVANLTATDVAKAPAPKNLTPQH